MQELIDSISNENEMYIIDSVLYPIIVAYQDFNSYTSNNLDKR